MQGGVKGGTPRDIASATGENPLSGRAVGGQKRHVAFACFPGFSPLKGADFFLYACLLAAFVFWATGPVRLLPLVSGWRGWRATGCAQGAVKPRGVAPEPRKCRRAMAVMFTLGLTKNRRGVMAVACRPSTATDHRAKAAEVWRCLKPTLAT